MSSDRRAMLHDGSSSVLLDGWSSLHYPHIFSAPLHYEPVKRAIQRYFDIRKLLVGFLTGMVVLD